MNMAEHIERLKKELMMYSVATDVTSYEAKSPLEREIVDLVAVINFKLEKFQLHITGGKKEERPQTAREMFASKLLQSYSAMNNGEVPISEKTASEFNEALDLLKIAKQAKAEGKTLMAKDALKGLGD